MTYRQEGLDQVVPGHGHGHGGYVHVHEQKVLDKIRREKHNVVYIP